jgi:hypothetical protein
MEKEPRKASEVLLELEAKLDILVGLVRAQDLTIKVLSNKLNSVMEKMDKQPTAPQIRVEAVNTMQNPFNQAPTPDPEKAIPISADFNLPVEGTPTGFRRTSRPETYAGDNSYLPQLPKPPEPKFPTQIPRPSGQAEVIVPSRTTGQKFPPTEAKPKQEPPPHAASGNVIPVSQRVVDGNGKSAFLADVEIIDLSSMQEMFKTRTNGQGKWSAPLPIGAYRVIIRKRESLTKEKLEAAQDIQVDGLTSPFELPLMIIKK